MNIDPEANTYGPYRIIQRGVNDFVRSRIAPDMMNVRSSR